MEVAYTSTSQDIAALRQYLIKQSKFRLWHLAAVAGVIAACVFVAAVVRAPNKVQGLRDGIMEIGPMLLIVAGMVFVNVHARRRAQREAEAMPGFWDPCVTRITPEGVYQRDGSGEGNVKWRNLYGVADDPTHVYLRLTKDLAYIVPKRAFATAAEANEFVRAARAYWGQAQTA